MSRHGATGSQRPGTTLPKPHPTGKYDRVVPSSKTRSMYFRGELLHREDGPAVEWLDGTQLFYIDGKLHGSPAIIYPNGDTKDYDMGVQTGGGLRSETPHGWPAWLNDIVVEESDS